MISKHAKLVWRIQILDFAVMVHGRWQSSLKIHRSKKASNQNVRQKKSRVDSDWWNKGKTDLFCLHSKLQTQYISRYIKCRYKNPGRLVFNVCFKKTMTHLLLYTVVSVSSFFWNIRYVALAGPKSAVGNFSQSEGQPIWDQLVCFISVALKLLWTPSS